VKKQGERALLKSLAELETHLLRDGAATRAEKELLYDSLVMYMLLAGRLGDPTHITLAREARAALESVLPPAEIPAFVALDRGARQEQLSSLVLVVSGIRLFNKLARKGGAAIPSRMSNVSVVVVEFC
jgi:hypothetical protein